MIFVTTGQRIAVENFSKGVIYKVTFTDESISYMMCVGIGKDFVMLQSTDPLLFSLTMQSASRVSTIDVHDPTPPEPPTPIENALQYQTGEPPFTFTTTENSLFSWYIEGEAGVKTANLFNEVYPNIDSSLHYLAINVGNGDFTLSTTCPRNQSGACLFFLAGNVSSGASTENNGVWGYSGSQYGTMKRTQTAVNGYVTIAYRSLSTDLNPVNEDTILNSGSTAQSYEPYGYKISISTNEHTTTIYLDEPIAEGEKLYSVNVDAQIVTDIGENTLSVSDPQPPEMQIVYGIYAEV